MVGTGTMIVMGLLAVLTAVVPLGVMLLLRRRGGGGGGCSPPPCCFTSPQIS